MAHTADQSAALLSGPLSRRAVLGGTLASAVAIGMADGSGLSAAEPRSAPDWHFMYDIQVRIPAGRLNDWIHFWNDKNVAALEDGGQYLWGAWYDLTGEQNLISHQWAYRNLAHFEEMVKMRSSNARVHELYSESIPILDVTRSAVLTPLPYHPSPSVARLAGAGGFIVTHQILRDPAGNAPEHDRMMADYVRLTMAGGATLLGAFTSYFGWAPAYTLQIWRYEDMNHYAQAQAALAASAEAARLSRAMREIFPIERIEIGKPLPYSRIG